MHENAARIHYGGHVLFQPVGDALDGQIGYVECIHGDPEKCDRYYVRVAGELWEVPIGRKVAVSTSIEFHEGRISMLQQLRSLGHPVPDDVWDRVVTRWGDWASAYGSAPDGVDPSEPCLAPRKSK